MSTLSAPDAVDSVTVAVLSPVEWKVTSFQVNGSSVSQMVS